MSSSSTLYNPTYHGNVNLQLNGNSNNNINSNGKNPSNSLGQSNQVIVNHVQSQQQHRNSPNSINNFIYNNSKSSQSHSPTVSLISSSSSSPTSSSSSPTQMSFGNNSNNQNGNIIITKHNSSPSHQQQGNMGFSSNGNNISAAKKSAALQSIAASIARSQQLANINQQQNSALANKILALTLENNGVSSSLVKSNTNIYYNSKVDTAASKAIHYCSQCSNSDCKAIHKSLTKPLNQNSQKNQHQQQPQQQTVNLSQSTALPSPSIAQPLSNFTNGNGSNTPTSSQQQQLARLFLTSKLEQLDKQSKLNNITPRNLLTNQKPTTNGDINNTNGTNQGTDNNSQSNQAANKMNFIFERRYPLVQLNSNFFNISAANPLGGSGSTESLINFINNAGQGSLLSPMTTSALLNNSQASNNGSNFHNHSSNRNILQYRGGHTNSHSGNLFSDEDNNATSSISSPSVSPKGTTMSFPLPISPTSSTDPIKSPPKSSNFSISVNNNNNSKPASQQLPVNANNISPPSNSSSPSSISSSSSVSLPSANKQQLMDEAGSDLVDSFPGLNRLDNLRYKNIMFLDQVSCKSTEPKSPVFVPLFST